MYLLERFVVNLLKEKNILRKLLIILPLNQEGLTSYLSPILGQFNIKSELFLKQFVIEFNRFTNDIFINYFDDFLNNKVNYLADIDLVIPLYLIIYRNGKFAFEFKTPSVGFLFRYIISFSKSNSNYKYIYYGIYKISYLKSLCVGLGLNQSSIKPNYIQIKNQLKYKIIKQLNLKK